MKYLLAIVILPTLWFAGSASAAPQSLGAGKIQWIENGWDGEGIAFKFSLPVAAGGCTSNLNEYAISKDHLGYKEMVSLLLSAQAMQSDVVLVVDASLCFVGTRTKVLAVRVAKS